MTTFEVFVKIYTERERETNCLVFGKEFSKVCRTGSIIGVKVVNGVLDGGIRRRIAVGARQIASSQWKGEEGQRNMRHVTAALVAEFHHLTQAIRPFLYFISIVNPFSHFVNYLISL